MCVALKTLHKSRLDQVPLAAFYLWRDHGSNPAVAKWLPVCLIAAAVLALLPALAVLCWPRIPARQLRPHRPGEPSPPPIRAASSLHGAADWMPEHDLLRLARGGDPDHGGVVYGTACRSDLHPGQDGGAAPLLVDRCLEDATHGLLFIGSGGGKTSAFVVPTLDPDVGWRGNALVNDPSSQAGPMCAGMRRDFGQRVVFLGPPRERGDHGLPRVGVNVFGWIDPAHPQFETHVWSVVESLGREATEADDKGDNAMFGIQGKALQACLLADLLSDPMVPKASRTPRLLSERVATPERRMKGLLQTIHEESRSRLARMLAGSLMEAHPKTFSGFCVNAGADLRWLLTEANADLVSGTAPGLIRADALVNSDVCIFLQLGVTTMQETPQLGRAILSALLNPIYRAPPGTTRRTLLVGDEIDLFGKLDVLSTAASQGRKHGLTVLGMWHSLSQMQDRWGEKGANTWRANASWEAYSAMDAKTAEDVSKRCGKYTALAPSEGHSRNSQSSLQQGSRTHGRSGGVTLHGRDLITPDEVERRLRKDEQIIFCRGANAPIRCIKAYYFRRPDMAAKVGRDAYRIAAE